MPVYKLNYFNGRGRAELTRLIFAVVGAQYTDNRIEFADWPALKEHSPLGQLPYLEVDGVILPQSLSIAKFVAREFNLAGKNNLEMVLTFNYTKLNLNNVKFLFIKIFVPLNPRVYGRI